MGCSPTRAGFTRFQTPGLTSSLHNSNFPGMNQLVAGCNGTSRSAFCRSSRFVLFGFVSDFGFRISDLSLGLPASSRRARPLSSPQSTHLPHLTWCISVGLLWFASSTHAAPRHVYLTWQGDTSTTITVNYQTVEETETSSVYYDTKARNGKISDYRFQAAGTRHKIEGLGDGRTIHWVELTQLKPGVSYYFVAGDLQHGFTAERKFQTIPDGHQPLRFVVGGDMVAGPTLPAFLQQAARHEPKFVAVGGDIAY